MDPTGFEPATSRIPYSAGELRFLWETRQAGDLPLIYGPSEPLRSREELRGSREFPAGTSGFAQANSREFA